MKRSLVFGSMAIALVASVGMAQSVNISNGVSGDGHLDIDIDGYGGYTVWNWAENHDNYDPAGSVGQGSPMFAGSFMIYANGFDAWAFGEPFFDIDGTYNLPQGTNLEGSTFELPTESSPSVNPARDTATSAWSIRTDLMLTPNDMSFDFELVQTVSAGDGSVALLTQVLTITNTGPDPVEILIQRHLDIDAAFPGGDPLGASAEDVSGTDDCAGTINPYIREPDGNRNSPTLISLTSPDGFDYVASKSGFVPPPGNTEMGFGTDFQIWNERAYPEGWRNYTAGIGQAPLVGELLGRRPAGSLFPWDNFINIEWALSLGVGESQTITAVTQYGTDCISAGCPCACNMDTTTGFGICDLFDFLAFQGGFVAGETCQCDIDLTTGPGVCDLFDFLAFQGEFVGGCR